MGWFVYILQCSNGDLYTGVTTDVGRRLREHQLGMGGRFTRSHLPVELLYQEAHLGEHEARSREVQLKTWSRTKKLALIMGDRSALKHA